jgi:hypothetical protein
MRCAAYIIDGVGAYFLPGSAERQLVVGCTNVRRDAAWLGAGSLWVCAKLGLSSCH